MKTRTVGKCPVCGGRMYQHTEPWFTMEDHDVWTELLCLNAFCPGDLLMGWAW